MKARKILIVGGLAAGPSAGAKALRVNPGADVTLFEGSETISYGICETPYAIGGLIPEEEKLIVYTPERLEKEKGVKVKTLHRVECVKPSERIIEVRNLRTHEMVKYEFDELILATGSSPEKLHVEGEEARNVFHLKTRSDTLNIIKYLKAEKPKQAVVIGGGYIGMEMSDTFRSLGLDVTLVHRHRLPLSSLEVETREHVLAELQRNEIEIVTNAVVEQLQTDATGRVRHVITNRGTFEADIVLIGVGVKPNVQLAREARIKIGTTGAIAVDEWQRTSSDHVYAAGDCCEIKNIVTGKPMYLPLATVASRAAWVAGENAAGGRGTFKGAIRAVAVKVFDLEVAQVGLSSDEAKANGFRTAAQTISASSRIGLMPGSKKLTVTLIIDQTTKRVLGANLIGGDGAALRANTLGVAIQHKMTVDDVSRFDLLYAPQFSPLWDPILVAANEAKKKLG